ncbi:AKAP7 2'5' RNA ligase-like domain-containing protein [Ditylenchus destructor]|nr:AKAP7 2'5' RNA ligase-like domain-containing protein [Ditylenchus destructor]
MDPLNVQVYQVESDIYRRNVPFEKVNQISQQGHSDFTKLDNEELSDYADAGCDERVSIPKESANDELEVQQTTVLRQEVIKDDNLQNMQKYEATAACTSSIDSQASNANSEDEEIEKIQSVVEETTSTIASPVVFDEKRKIYQTKLPVANSLIGWVLGPRGTVKQKLEKSLNCRLYIDKRKGCVEVSAETVEIIQKCQIQIEKLLSDGKAKSMPTHFVSVELSDDILKKKYAELVELICSSEDISEQCKEKTLFRPVEKLHLTISVLKLFTQDDEEAVKKCIKEAFEQNVRKLLNGDFKIKVDFDGFDCFDKDPTKARVLYAKISSEQLQKVADAIDDALFKTGLASKRRTAEVTLHLTIMNTKYARSNLKLRKMDVTSVLEKIENFKFEPVEVNEIRVCIMQGVDKVTNGYPSIFEIKF